MGNISVKETDRVKWTRAPRQRSDEMMDWFSAGELRFAFDDEDRSRLDRAIVQARAFASGESS
jgi:hypothetical protein